MEKRYNYLEARPHRWRRQLSISGRRLTVGQLLGQMRANGWDAEQTAAAFDVPLGAVLEAIDYGTRFADIISADDAEERRRREEH